MRIILRLLALLGIGLTVYIGMKSAEFVGTSIISIIFIMVFSMVFIRFPNNNSSVNNSVDVGTKLSGADS